MTTAPPSIVAQSTPPAKEEIEFVDHKWMAVEREFVIHDAHPQKRARHSSSPAVLAREFGVCDAHPQKRAKHSSSCSPSSALQAAAAEELPRSPADTPSEHEDSLPPNYSDVEQKYADLISLWRFRNTHAQWHLDPLDGEIHRPLREIERYRDTRKIAGFASCRRPQSFKRLVIEYEAKNGPLCALCATLTMPFQRDCSLTKRSQRYQRPQQ